MQNCVTVSAFERGAEWDSHDGLAAAVGQARDGTLVGHRRGKPQRIDEGVSPARVPGEPAPTDSLPEDGGVHGHDDR